MGFALGIDQTRSPTLGKVTQQHLLLAETLSRRDVLAYRADWPLRPVSIHVIRNCQVESIAGSTPAFLAHADLAASWSYSDYDDSLSLSGFDIASDVVVVWLDYRRYSLDGPALSTFIASRLEAIRARSTAPILIADDPHSPHAPAVNDALTRAAARISGVFVYSRAAVARRLGPAFYDARLAKIAGSDLSAAAGLLIARELGLSWLPALTQPALKCIALDLDNTLYSGVIGEDGAHGVTLTSAHRALQSRLVAFRQAGMLLALVSKNVLADVDALFAARPDFPIRPEMISARAIGWGSKRQGLDDIAATLNIGADAILFVDDNLGEIAQTAGATVLYAADPLETLRALDLFPGLRALRTGREDALRADDVAMNKERTRLAAQGEDYRAVLKPKLRFRLADANSVARAQELSNKTNQFNLALSRFTAAEAMAFVAGADTDVVEAALSDSLSDSGTVLSMFTRMVGDVLLVEDLCISCRALGREIEDAMILQGLLNLAERRGACELSFRHATGPRNGPARTWLGTFASEALPDDGVLPVPLAAARDRLAVMTIATSWD